jgi:hypothetical protein
VVIADRMVETAISTIVTASKTGKIGDGKVFVSVIEEAFPHSNYQNRRESHLTLDCHSLIPYGLSLTEKHIYS